jgi:hypothetical protein
MKNVLAPTLAPLVLILAATIWTPDASADEVTFNVNGSYVFPDTDGSIVPITFTEPNMFVTGTLSFDVGLSLLLDHNEGQAAPMTYDLHFSWLGGGIEYSGSGGAHCPDLVSVFGGTWCYINPTGPFAPGDSFGFQTNLFNPANLTPGYVINTCAARYTLFPDGQLGLASGVCGGSDGASIQGHSGVGYGLPSTGEWASDTGATSSITFTVAEPVSTPEPSSGMLGLWAMALLAGILLTKSKGK